MPSDRVVKPTAGLTLRYAAIIAGVGLLLEAVTQPIGVLYGIPHLIASGDAAATASNIQGSPGLFRASLAIILAGVFMDIFVAWGLYVFFRPANKSLSLVIAVLRWVGATLAAVSLTYAVYAFQLLQGSSYGNGLNRAELNAQAFMSLGEFTYGYDFALIFFGAHLMLLGYLVFRSGYLTQLWGAVLGGLIVLAGLGYVVDNIGRAIFPGYSVTISTFTFVGELLLAIWLVLWGRKVEVAAPGIASSS